MVFISDENTTLLIQTIPEILKGLGLCATAIISALGYWKSRKNGKKLVAHNTQISTEIGEVKDIVNGKGEKALAEAKAISFAEGVAAGKLESQ